jgi:hypothetical protein
MKYFIIFIAVLFGCQESYGGRDSDAPPKEKPVDELLFQDHVTGIPLANLDETLAGLNLQPYHMAGYYGQDVTIAILDNGFEGIEASQNRTIPPSISLGKEELETMGQTFHGTKLAEIVYAVSTGKFYYDPRTPAPDIKLFVTNGPFQKLEKAVGDVIKIKQNDPMRTVIVLYSQIWEYGGNVNGSGFINSLVNKALAEGVIWVNAAGNLGKSTYYAQVEVAQNNDVKLPLEERYLKLTVAEQTQVKVVLAWKDFADSYYHYYTKQDLDLILEDAQGKVLGQGALRQDGIDHGGAEGFSRHAREMIMASLPPGEYLMRVVAKSNNFSPSSRFWITVDGGGAVQLEQSNGDQVVFMPADNPKVLTVGATDYDLGNSKIEGDTKVKPNFLTPSIMTYTDGVQIAGTSTAAAVAAASLAVFRSAWGPLVSQNLFDMLGGEQLGQRVNECLPSQQGQEVQTESEQESLEQPTPPNQSCIEKGPVSLKFPAPSQLAPLKAQHLYYYQP